MNLTVTEAIKGFLNSLILNYAKDLTDLYTHDMEVQVNVNQTLGELVYNHNKGAVWELNDPKLGIIRYWNIRIPKNAKGDTTKSYPKGEIVFNDPPLSFPIDIVADSIGMTGWNWVKKQSMWVGYDFDSIAGHAPGVGLADDKLEEIKEKACSIPWIQVRRSTGGNGLHLYAYFDPDNSPETPNHNVHAAAARAVLGMMSREVGFNFTPHVDCYGGILWVWARRINPQNRGLELIKNHEDYIPKLPENWYDNISVITGKSTKITVSGVVDNDSFDNMSSSTKKVPLSEKHLLTEQRIADLGYSIIWTPDHHSWQSHTKAFEDLMENWPEDYQGIYETNSEGTDPSKPNCFLFPMEDDGFRIVRFNPGAKEAECWNQDGKGWTWIYFNRPADLRTTSLKLGGIEDPDHGGWVFNNITDVERVVELLGGNLNMDKSWATVFTEDRSFKLRENKQGYVVAEMSANKSDKVPDGWIRKQGKFVKKVTIKAQPEILEKETFYDDKIRALVAPTGDFSGWVVKDNRGQWVGMDKSNVRSVLKALDLGDGEKIMGHSTLNAWRLVNMPFQPEYPGNREWNRDAVQFKFEPGESGAHPTWDMILTHCGDDLTEEIEKDEWCQKYGITSGKEYLLTWVASLFKHPFDQLPYLFFYGPQNSGKSSFHESLSLLINGGIVFADEALKNQQGFNGELANAILCIVEETNLSQVKHAYNRLKAWVTGIDIRIRPMYSPVYMQRNSTHWIQCGNSFTEVPDFPGDTRIVWSWVPVPEVEIPKDKLRQSLITEAPTFLRTLLDTRIPPAPGRLRLPVIITDEKRNVAFENQSVLAKFIREQCYYQPGALTPFQDFYDMFFESLRPDQGCNWNKQLVSQAIREQDLALIGRHSANKTYIGNLLLHPPDTGKNYGRKFIRKSNYLKRLEE